MDKILKLKKKYNLFLIEDAAHAFLAKYKKKYIGTLGEIGMFSFHETKNFTSGQGGALLINDNKYINLHKILNGRIYTDCNTNVAFIKKTFGVRFNSYVCRGFGCAVWILTT